MRKNVLSFILIFTLIFTVALPGGISFAGNVDENALDLFLEKLSGMSAEKREVGAELLRQYMRDGDSGISQLKKDLNILVNDTHKETLENYSYTIDDVRNELDILYSWSQDDRILLTKYIRDGQTGDIKRLVNKYKNGSAGGNSTPAIGGGSAPSAVNNEIANTGANKPEKQILEILFTDIDKHPLKDDIVFLAERGIIKGRTEDKFVPEGELTRAEFVTLIVRVLKLEPKDEKVLSFKDVNNTDWFYEAVKIAYDYKIVDGTSSTTFSPNDKVTREQMIVIIMRILNEKDTINKLEDTGKVIDDFKDSEQLSPWAVEHMTNGVKYGLFDGRTKDTLNPRDNAMRAEAAQILKKLYDILNKEAVEVMGR